MVAHHTVGGCNLRPGDLLGTGTISHFSVRGFSSQIQCQAMDICRTLHASPPVDRPVGMGCHSAVEAAGARLPPSAVRPSCMHALH
jgi:2-keto-4-pentenoate hydratase/2-oxohepta-3-ene-1,7-dioic acid hydratase in catechol pathway